MTSFLLAGPASEPVSLAEAKGFLRVDSNDEDAFVGTLIAAARVHLESVTGRAMLAQSWRVIHDDWPQSRTVTLPVAPLISLTSIVAFDPEGIGHALALAQFQPETLASPARLFLPAPVAGMPALRDHAAIEIDYVAGFGASPDDVPADLRQALLTLFGRQTSAEPEGGHEISYVALGAAWARVRALVGQISAQGDGRTAIISHKIILRFRTDLAPGDRIESRGIALDIVSAEDLNGRRAYLICRCTSKSIAG